MSRTVTIDPAIAALWPYVYEYIEDRGLVSLPPLDDYDVESAATRGELPSFATDKIELVRRLGGEIVVSKPRQNFEGLSDGAELVVQRPFTGEHVSTDWAFRGGLPLWGIATLGVASGKFGQFDCWCCPHSMQNLPKFNLPGYTGILNVEAIGGNIIEAHMRPSLEFFRLYGRAASFAVADAARGVVSDHCPPVDGGVLVPVGREAHVETISAITLKEASWRRALMFVTSEQ